ncbi:hypothetical protein Nepgr_014940 [Nepenthes gracilis]|uniref:Uncharacterized protein n=1 Tax=Nepenthes gracilis TaxID=150966 RepID=A0AAD3SM22_NEPGR|nr:hypothetical protein Nepgr_014940 [Nepenthes gracilis]
MDHLSLIYPKHLLFMQLFFFHSTNCCWQSQHEYELVKASTLRNLALENQSEEMDIEALYIDLISLRKLYGLLKLKGDCQQDAISETLDANSRLFLKNLLDNAAERIFETHSQDISKDPEVSGAIVQKSKWSSPELNSKSIFSDASKLSNSTTECRIRKKRCHACHRKNMQQLIFTKEMKGCSEKTRVPNKDSNFQYQPQKIGSKSPIKDLESKECLDSIRKDTLRDNRNFKIKHNLSGEENVDSKAKEAAKLDDFSEEVDAKIKKIESLLSSLKLFPNPVCTHTEKNACHPLGSIKDGDCASIDLSQTSKSVVHDHDLLVSWWMKKCGEEEALAESALMSQKQNCTVGGNGMQNQKLRFEEGTLKREEVSLLKKNESQTSELGPLMVAGQWNGRFNGHGLQGVSPGWAQRSLGLVSGGQTWENESVPGQRVRAIVESIESPSQIANGNEIMVRQTPHYIQGLRISPSQFNKEDTNWAQTPRKEAIRKTIISRPLTPAPSVGSTNFIEPHRMNQAGDSDHRPTQINTREKNSRENKLCPPNASEIDRKSRIAIPRNEVLSSHWESEETSWDSPSSSSWTSRPSSSYASSSRMAQPTSSGGSESEEFESSNRRSGQYLGPPSECVSHESSSDYDASSDNNQDLHGGLGPACRVGVSKCYSLDNQVDRVKGAGRLRRFKNKLGMIFHHHHHHHHHHHNGSDEDEAGHAKSFWRLSRKIFQHKRERDNDNRQPKVKKSRKPISRSVQRKQQGGHFHALVEGLMRHIRLSKKSKPPMEAAIRRQRNALPGGRKAGKSLNRWKTLQDHHGVTLPGKVRAKLGPRAKKPQISVAKMLLRQ